MNTAMNFEVTDYRKIAASDCIEDVIAVSKKLGKRTVTYEEYLKYGKYNYSTLRKKFGRWRKVLERAGLENSSRHWHWDTEAEKEKDLFDNLTKVWLKLGRQPKQKEMIYPLSVYSCSVYARHFGTWMEALKMFSVHKKKECAAAGEQGKGSAGNEPVSLQEEKMQEGGRVERDKRYPSLRLKYEVFKRDGYRCTCCGKSPATHPGVILQCDHIRAWSKGGRTIFENLTTLCSECNIGKGDRMME